MRKNTFIKKENYEKLKSTSIRLDEKLDKAGFNEEEIDTLELQGQIKNKANALHGSSYAHFSSFLYYHKDKSLKIELRSKERDFVNSKNLEDKKDWYNIEVLQDWDKIGESKLRAGYVFIGANAGAGAKDLSFEQFENFHNTGHSKIEKYCNSFTSDRDFYMKMKGENIDESLLKEYNLKYQKKKKNEGDFLRYNRKKENDNMISDKEFLEENIIGSYCTDFVKGLPTPDSKELIKEIEDTAKDLYNKDTEKKYEKEFKSVEEYQENFKKRFANGFVDILLEELDLLGNITHTLILMDSKSTVFIQTMLDLGDFEKKYNNKDNTPINIHTINHYCTSTPQHIWKFQLEEIFGRDEKSEKRMKDWVANLKDKTEFKGVEFEIIN